MIAELLIMGILNVQSVDTAKVVKLGEVEVVSSIKENSHLRHMPMSSTSLSRNEIETKQITSLKSVSTLAPNLFMPDYGSRLTSAIYIRGIGSRINTPAVGLYVDNMPQIDKSAFDFKFSEIERIDVMRGPQSTLYGRNSMGGLIKIYTRNPFTTKGTTLQLGYASKSNQRTASLTHYQHFGNKIALSLNGYYEGNDGLFRNAYTGKKEDDRREAGGRMRLMMRPSQKLTFDLNASYDYTDEGAYPYYYTGSATSTESFSELIGKISNNRQSSYRRGLLKTGLNIEWKAKPFTFNSITSYQNLTDRMMMDQDFISADIYTLEQRQRINTLSQEFTLRHKQHLTGANIYYQWLHTKSPVTFYKDGIAWMQSTINSHMPDLSSSGITSMNCDLSKNESLNMGGTFDTPTFGTALYHQSIFNLSKQLELTAGLRLDYERISMDYNAPAKMIYDFTMQSSRMPISLTDQIATASFIGTCNQDYLQLLPKLSLKWKTNGKGNIYATFSKGMRSGGYNIQMFSDLLQSELSSSMMKGIKQGATDYLNMLAQRGMPQRVIDGIISNLDQMPTTETPDVSPTTSYKPEYAWNYEIGTHQSFTLGTTSIALDADIFYISTHNQQIARFSANGLGRQMVNAGRSRSYGAEIAFNANTPIADRISINYNVGYGYTNAKFTHYDAGNNKDYSGKRIPFAPEHTLNAGVGLRKSFADKTLRVISFNLRYNGAGDIYWDEANTSSTNFNGTLQASVTSEIKDRITLTLWGHNLTNSQYATFKFTSMQRNYEQRCKPLQIGADLKIKL